MFSATARHNQARLGFENASTTNQAFFEPFFNSLLGEKRQSGPNLLTATQTCAPISSSSK
jgi:hypothetical protein